METGPATHQRDSGVHQQKLSTVAAIPRTTAVPQLDALAERTTTHKVVICVSDPSEEGSEPDSGKEVRPLREHDRSRASKR